jgi:hypothetical protein
MLYEARLAQEMAARLLDEGIFRRGMRPRVPGI